MGTVVNYGWVQWNEMADLICQLGGGGGEPVERMLDRYVLLHVMHLWTYGYCNGHEPLKLKQKNFAIFVTWDIPYGDGMGVLYKIQWP